MTTKIYIVLTILTLSVTAWAQGVSINETGANPDGSAILDVSSTTKVFLMPRMTTIERDAIVNPPQGSMVYNITLSCLQVNDGTPATPFWNCISNSAGIPDGVIATIDCAGATHNGVLTEGQAASGVNSVIGYIGGNGGVHSGQVVTSTGVTGLTATLAAGTFANGAGTLTYSITGTPASSGTASFAINIGGQSCSLTRTVIPIWSAGTIHCNPANITAIEDVTNGFTGKTWMDRNLGANRAATSSTDAQSYGSLYQWGRGSDGHQCVIRYGGDGVTTSGTTATLSSSDTLGHGDFITIIASPNDWRSPQNNNLWQGVNGTNNPCPTGYRLPTEAELNNERLSWVQAPISSTNAATGAFASPLKLPMAGFRDNSNGSLDDIGSTGYYWSSTVSGSTAIFHAFNSSDANMFFGFRAYGLSVRCLKD